MRLDLADLPSDVDLLQRLVREMADVVESRDGEIERLQSIIKKLQRAQFGRRSERLDADQLALALEDLDADITRIRERNPAPRNFHRSNRLIASLCPITCSARMSFSISTTQCARAVAAPFIRSARASARCSTLQKGLEYAAIDKQSS
ncbi:hypothetical protein EOB77_19475 [Mesorhizobium sp. M7A.F.Ca.MR.228.00.0.0]|nr:hypothetical protein EOB80_09720 [Mesorhizobium sp. M7A.F.Ca.MR.245.00.0.0]RUV49456.1 hypothetical protein EOB77_19475 [Mesorhizobium sp. M7A.F.Ca.MR.228.00.0.0]